MSTVERINDNLRSAWKSFFPPPRYGYNQQDKREPLATLAHIVVFGLSIVMVGLNCFWSTGLAIGYYPFLAGTMVVGSCALVLSCCLAEMTSALPFSGGIYGFVRLTLGPYLGFLVGIFEIFQAIVYSAYYMVEIGHIVTTALHVDQLYSPIVWFVFSIFSVFLNIRGNHTFWNFQWVLAMFSLVILLVFIFSSIQSADTNQYINHEKRPEHFSSTSDRLHYVFRYFLSASWFFSGFEMIPLTCSDAIEPKKSVAYGILYQMLIVLLLAPVIITAACIQSPGFNVLSEEALPLTFGFMNNFSLSSSMSALLFVPALFQSYHAYVYVFGRLLRSMADSRLLPSILQSYHSKHHTPYVGIVAGSLAVFCLMFLRLFASHSYDILCGISSIGTIFIYLLIACSFCIFRQRYQTLERQVVNPFGVAGSIYAILIILLALISVCAFIPYGYLLISFFFVLVFFVTLFYFFYARHKQRFSEDEQKIFFLAYVINANRGKTKAMNKRSKSMYMTADHNSTASTSIRSYRRISDSSAGGRVDLSHRSKPPGLNSPETSVDRRMSRISSPKPSSVNSSENHAGRCSSPGSLSPAKMLQDGDQRQLSQDNISVDTRYTMVENLFTITEENNGIKLDAGSLDDADTQAIIDRDMVLESFPSSTILMEDFKSPRNLLATGKKLSEKKLTINAPLSAEDPMTSTVADIPTTKKPMSIETKRKMMILKMAAFGGFKDRSEVVKNKNRITLPPIESTKHRTSDPLPKVFEDEHITEFPSMEHVIARRKSFTEQQQQLQLQNSESMDEEDPKAKVVDESYMHHLDSQHKSASMFRRGFGGTIMSSIKVLSSMKVVPFVNDPLFNEYTEEFVNSRLGETEKIQQQQQRRYLEQLRREYSFAPVEEVASPRSQTKQEEDFESNKHPTNTGDADPVLTYDFPQELSEEHIPSTSAEQQHDLESNGRH